MNSTVRRRTQVITTAIVALFCAAASFTHITELAHRHGQEGWIALGYPLAVDGMILVGSLSLASGNRGFRAVTAFIVGVFSSLAANVLVAPADLISQVISAFPAVSLLITVEVIIHGDGKHEAGDDTTAATTIESETAASGHGLQEGHEAAMTVPGHEVRAATETATAIKDHDGQEQDTAIIAKDPKVKQARTRRRADNRTPEELAAAAAEFLTDNRDATGVEVATAIGRSVRSGRRYKAAGLKLLADHGHEFAATAKLPVDLAEDIDQAVTGHADAEDLTEYGHDLMDHIADMAAVS